ncbi:MAG: histidine phosphatase family protein [Clostridia bacterium]|nr:histidine phosphatase family protein [Clostridia bacterium]
MLLFYIRHGEPIYKPDSLTARGEEQARALVSRMERVCPDRIFSSTSTRAIRTAMPTAAHFHLPIRALSWCHESLAAREFLIEQDGKRNWIFYLPREKQMLCSEEVRALGNEWYRHPYYAGRRHEQGILRVRRETDAFLADLGYRHDHARHCFVAERPSDERIALFAHEGFGALFLSEILDIPLPYFAPHFGMGHSGMTVIDFRGDGAVIPRVLQLSNDSHLFAQELEIIYQGHSF